MQTTTDFARSFGIIAKCERCAKNPHMISAFDGDHWKCVLKGAGSQMTVYFSMGRGHNGKPPQAEDILDCLASDAAGIENARDFTDWALEYGYDPDSRHIEHGYKRVILQAAKLKRFLGEPAYERLLWDTERL